MYFQDLSRYKYWNNNVDTNTLNIGWLDYQHAYPQGDVSTAFLDALWMYCKHTIYLSLGYHTCDFCQEDLGVIVVCHGETLTLGSAEIRVMQKMDHTYAAPDMIYHYIVDHHYLPPQQLINAVLEHPYSFMTQEYSVRYGHL